MHHARLLKRRTRISLSVLKTFSKSKKDYQKRVQISFFMNLILPHFVTVVIVDRSIQVIVEMIACCVLTVQMKKKTIL